MTLIGSVEFMMNFNLIPWNDITKFGQQTMLDSDLFSVSWILGRFCNYKCSYCWPYARSDKLDYQDFLVYTNAVDEIKTQARANGFTKFHWSFSGGEPTAYKKFLELLEHVNEDIDYQSLHMTTNLSPGEQWWTRWLANTSEFSRRSITASYHAEFANEQEFGDKILFLMQNNVFVTINQVMVPEKFTEYYDRCQRFADRGINVTLKPQSDPTASFVVNGYTEEMIALMRSGFPQQVKEKEIHQIRLTDSGGTNWYLDQAERFNAFGFNKFKDWTCNAGYQSVIIRSNEVKRSYSCHDEALGSLESFSLFSNPQKCITPSCVSSADSKIPKCK
jgi:organic radical activating enzyme